MSKIFSAIPYCKITFAISNPESLRLFHISINITRSIKILFYISIDNNKYPLVQSPPPFFQLCFLITSQHFIYNLNPVDLPPLLMLLVQGWTDEPNKVSLPNKIPQNQTKNHPLFLAGLQNQIQQNQCHHKVCCDRSCPQFFTAQPTSGG